jgi:hypothetical protein
MQYVVYNYHVTPLRLFVHQIFSLRVYSKRCSQGPRRLSTYIIITKAQTTARLSLSPLARARKKNLRREIIFCGGRSGERLHNKKSCEEHHNGARLLG